MAPADKPPAREPMTDEERWAVLDPWGQTDHLESVQAGDAELRLGDRVLLRPGVGADILDMALAGKVGVIQAIEQSIDDEYQIAVVLEELGVVVGAARIAPVEGGRPAGEPVVRRHGPAAASPPRCATARAGDGSPSRRGRRG